MRTTPVLSYASAGMLAVILSGCGRGLPDAVPEGYERVGDQVAIRADGAHYSANGHSVPAAELFEGGEYALVTLNTDCRGQLAASAGTRFGSDGTLRGDVAARGWRKMEGEPALRSAAEHLCKLAEHSRTVSDPNDDRAVMAMLFADGHGNPWATWLGPSAGDKGEQTTRNVRVLKKGRYTDGPRQFAYVITGADDPECTANVCDGGIVGAALFEQVESKWFLRAHDTTVDVVGEAGQMPPPSAMRMLTTEGSPPLFAIEWRTMKFGEGFGGYRVYGFVSGHFKTVLSQDGWADTTGTSGCAERGDCADYATTLSLGQAGGAWPELVAHRVGRDSIAGQPMRIDEHITYRFDGKGAYLEVDRKANNVPIVVATPAQSAAMAAMRPVVIEAVREAWRGDPKFSAAELTGLELEPESDTVYRGLLGVRMAGAARQFPMRIEVRPGPEYAWAFVKE